MVRLRLKIFALPLTRSNETEVRMQPRNSWEEKLTVGDLQEKEEAMQVVMVKEVVMGR